MSISFRKGLLLILAIGSMVVFVASCKQAPTVQPWEREKGKGTTVNSVIAKEDPAGKTPEKTAGVKDIHQTPEPTRIPVPIKYVPVNKVKETTPAHLKETLQIKECTVSINADILTRAREPQSCPVYRAEPFKYDLEEIVRLIYGKNADDALAYDKTIPKRAEDPELYHYRSGNVVITADNSAGWLNMANNIPRYVAVNEEDRNANEPKDAQAIPSGICDAISFSREEAIEKARAYIQPLKFPVDLTLPRMKACQWYDFQYYEITFEQLYGGIPAYTNSLAIQLAQYVSTSQCVSVKVSQEGVLSIQAYLSHQTGTEVRYDRVIDFDTAYGLFKEYMYDRLTQVPAAEIGIAEIEFAYFPVLPKEYDGSHWLMVPCWIFLDPISSYTIVIAGPDGSLVQDEQAKGGLLNEN